MCHRKTRLDRGEEGEHLHLKDWYVEKLLKLFCYPSFLPQRSELEAMTTVGKEEYFGPM